jgi:fatty-acyl-CoA synthase
MLQQELYISKLLQQLQRAGDRVVLRDRNEAVCGDAFAARIFQYANALRELGIGRGSVLGLLAPNRPDAIAIRYAAHVLGAATVYLSRPPTQAQRLALVERIAPDLLVLFPETVECLGPDMRVPFATVGIDRVGAKARLDVLAAAASAAPLDVQADADELAVISSSGGSTGVPKGSCRSFAAYSAMVSAPSPGDRIQLVNGPLAYLSQVLVDNTLLGGGRVVLHDGFDADDTLAAIEQQKITDLFLVEPQLFELMDHPCVDTHDLSSLRSLSHIGASAPPTLRLRARRRFGPILGHLYGASEMGVVSVLTAPEHDLSCVDRFSCAGRIRPGVEVRFRRADGRLAEAGETGTIEVRSAALSSGYRNNPELTAQSFQQGWYLSGDLGRLDADGFLYILGRAGDARDIGGILVTPTEIEDALCRHPSIRYAVVVRDAATETTIAAVVAWPGLAIDARECRKAVAGRLGDSVAASLVAVPMDHVPLTEQGKPDRAAIARLARGVVAA